LFIPIDVKAVTLRKQKSIMKKILFSTVIALAFLTSCGNSTPTGKADSTATVTPTGGTNVAGVVYQCPMKCEGEKTYDKPGKCPMCQMDMKEVKK
jgi:Cu2+-exporting ATPase